MPSALLSNLAGIDGSSFLLLEDSVKHKGRLLLYALINYLAERVDQIHILTSETDPEEVTASFGPEVRRMLILHDYWTNPCAWNDSDALQLNSKGDWLSRVYSKLRTPPNKVAVVIDSISSFLPYQTDSQSCTEIQSLLTAADTVTEIQSMCVLGLLHTNLHRTKTLKALRYMANIQVRLQQEESNSTTYLKDACGMFEIIVNKKSGKVKRQKEIYNVSSRLELTTTAYEQGLQATTYADTQPDPTANLTFNLSLKDSERKAKENVVLPYISRQSQSSDSAKIFYEPDEADDFDEEDPDDDLDI